MDDLETEWPVYWQVRLIGGLEIRLAPLHVGPVEPCADDGSAKPLAAVIGMAPGEAQIPARFVGQVLLDQGCNPRGSPDRAAESRQERDGRTDRFPCGLAHALGPAPQGRRLSSRSDEDCSSPSVFAGDHAECLDQGRMPSGRVGQNVTKSGLVNESICEDPADKADIFQAGFAPARWNVSFCAHNPGADTLTTPPLWTVFRLNTGIVDAVNLVGLGQ